MEVILTLDIGTTNMKAAFHDFNGNTVSVESVSSIPKYFSDGRVEMDAGVFKKNLISLLGRSACHARQKNLLVEAVSVTAQRSSVLPVDSAGDALFPFIMWQDKRSAGLCEELKEFESVVYKKTGLRISPVFSAVKMLWLKREHPELMKQTVKLVGIQDFVIKTLCGKYVTDYSFASRTNLFNLHKMDWDDDLLDLFDVDRDKLCTLIPQGSLCGRLSAEAARLTGLSEGLPIVSAGGDQQCAVIGNGVFSSGKLLCNAGTSSYIIGSSNEIVLDNQENFFCNVGAVPGKYIIEAGMLTGGSLYRWISEQFFKEFPEKCRFDSVNREIEKSPVGANGVIVLPHMSGSGCPYWNPSDCGVIYNLSMDTTRGDIARAALESITLEMKYNSQLIKESLNESEDFVIYSAGGLANYEGFNQMLAEACGMKIISKDNVQATAKGAWMAAAVALGIYDGYDNAYISITNSETFSMYEPVSSYNVIYEDIYKRRKELYSKLHSYT